MAEVGLELRIKGGKIVFSYRAREYEIRSYAFEPCTYICQGDQILHKLHQGIEAWQVEKMVMSDKSYASNGGRMVDRELLLHTFASTIDDGRDSILFDEACELGTLRQKQREAYLQRLDEIHHAERKQRLEAKTSVQPSSDRPQTGKARMKKYIYRGETERNFYLAFTQAHELDEYNIRVGKEKDIEPEEPMGVILVAKDYDGDWIAQLRYYLDWEIVFVPAAAKYVKGFSDPHWEVLEDHTDEPLDGFKRVIFQTPGGRIVATTSVSKLDIAESLEEYRQMDPKQVQFLCYCSYMGRAR